MLIINILQCLILSFFSYFEEERRLDIDEKPLVVQLNWNKDDREGRFVLKNENDALPPKVKRSNVLYMCIYLNCISEFSMLIKVNCIFEFSVFIKIVFIL